MTLAILLGALFFALAAFVGALLGNAAADNIEPFDDGPQPGKPPAVILVFACAAIGAIIAPRAADPFQVVTIAIVCGGLVAAWCCDVRSGIMPDTFTLVPLLVLLGTAVWQHSWMVLASAVIVFVPFAIAAVLSRGTGMGWGDVKLAALGGAVLGAELSLVSFALACLIAVIVHYTMRGKRGAIALGPYLAAAIGLGIPFGLLR
jgi:prepilin signal peptidase PulO-like enzyme (type II secretory pathway)